MSKCQDCAKWIGDCKKPVIVCDEFEKVNRTITKLDKAEDEIFEFSKLEVADDIK